METHIKKCFKSPHDFKNVPELGAVIQRKNRYTPLLVEVEDFDNSVPGPSSAGSVKSSSSSDMLSQSLAKAIFVSASPLSMVEHPLWIDFFKRIRPSSYRNKELEEERYLHLKCDGWSNLKNESIINFIVFVEFVMSKTNSHNAEYLAQLITNVLE
ncbi:hypothetical protein RI129_006102 [Pyrocoelia pectoralis]|uniref:Uncharacterized protein n=1 Tax=Pyrocoelia pectoralis TaxID=417401 RepID=A0AAN7VBW6_9COLE